MEAGEIIGYALTALGGGGVTQFFNWRLNKRKDVASVKSDEIETMRKAMQDFYDPLVKKQNERIAELEQEVKDIRDEKRQMQAEYLKQIDSLQKDYQAQIAALQTQIIEINKALGINAKNTIRTNKSQTKKEKV